jgi:tetratricopeptide (TPR) repeat protein
METPMNNSTLRRDFLKCAGYALASMTLWALGMRPLTAFAQSSEQTAVPGAYDAFLRGWEHYRRTTPEDFAKAIPYFEKAIELDPDYGRAYAAVAMVYAHAYVSRWNYRLGISRSKARARANQYLKEAQKHKTALAHQVAGILLEGDWQHAPALSEFKEAIALEPGDSWSHALMAFTLTSVGRPAEAIPYIRTAMRLDPHHPSLFMYVLGLTEFSLEHFEAAAAAAETSAKLNPDDEGAFLLLAATYGHLGRRQDAEAAIARFNDIQIGRGDIPVTISTSRRLNLSKKEDSTRLFQGLRLAGVPESLSSDDFVAKHGMTVDEIRSLFFGHRLHGRSFESGEVRAASITQAGVATLSGDWAAMGGGRMADCNVRFKGEEVCFVWMGTLRQCGAVFRTRGGLKSRENEFFWHHGDRAFTFSQVE